MKLIKKTSGEGEIFNKWLESRLIRQNKNVLSAELGATGSGKSYRDLRKAELWYKYHFKEEFPAEKNICFGVEEVMKRLSEDNLRKGEIIVVEEAGVNLGSREWQSKFSRMFNYVLQSFRSMNVAIFFNLPYLSMLDKQARHLLHYYAESVSIDPEAKTNKCKPFFVQVAQSTGKVYRHYPKVRVNGKMVKIKRFVYHLPSQHILDVYESKKDRYLKKLIKGYSDKINGKKKDRSPSQRELEVYNLYEHGGFTMEQVGKKLDFSPQYAHKCVKRVREWLELKNNRENKGDVGKINQPSLK